MEFTDKYLNMGDDDLDCLLMNIDLSEKKTEVNFNDCIGCGSDNLTLDVNNGYKVCADCGIVNKDFLNNNPEFNQDKTASSRYGCPTNYFYKQSALGTKIKTKGFSRIANIQRQGQMPYKEKSLMENLKKITERCKKYNITTPIIDNAKNLYKKVRDCKHVSGKRKDKSIIMRCINRRSMIAACLFYACKFQGETRSPKEIAEIYDLDVKNVNRGTRKFEQIVDVNKLLFKYKSSQSSDFIVRNAEKLNMDKKYIKIAKDISDNILKLGIASTHEPPSVAAGCLLLVVNMYHLQINKKNISDIFNISDVTIAKTYRRIHPYHKIITNNEITNLVLEKKNSKKKHVSNVTKDNLVITDDNYLSEETEESITESSEDVNDFNKKSNSKFSSY